MSPLPHESSVHALRGLAWYGQRKPVFTGGNEVALLRGATEQFPSLCQAIDGAQQSVWMATYLVSPEGQSGLLDATGQAFGTAGRHDDVGAANATARHAFRARMAPCP